MLIDFFMAFFCATLLIVPFSEELGT